MFKVSMDNITKHVSSIHLQKIAESYDHKSGVHQLKWKKKELKEIHTGLSEVYHHFPQVWHTPVPEFDLRIQVPFSGLRNHGTDRQTVSLSPEVCDQTAQFPAQDAAQVLTNSKHCGLCYVHSAT